MRFHVFIPSLILSLFFPVVCVCGGGVYSPLLYRLAEIPQDEELSLFTDLGIDGDEENVDSVREDDEEDMSYIGGFFNRRRETTVVSTDQTAHFPCFGYLWRKV